MSFHIVIPSRFGSTRLPGKPLLDIAGKPMVQHVCEQAARAGGASITVATDDDRIRAAVEAFGGRAALTSADHPSGTDRLEEVARQLALEEGDILVNVQGDEPLIPPEIIRQVADNLSAHPDCVMATLSEPIEDAETLHDPNVVKVLSDKAGKALYFSRAVIPWARDAFASHPGSLPADTGMVWQRHIGIYAYRVGFLKRFVEWGACTLEKTESLEQLRALWHGERIHVAQATVLPGPGVDTQADLEKVRQLLEQG
jgi:3-deoxy-manno-octulosonate cytidylyltransferase (CMP-KDO synthetase)